MKTQILLLLLLISSQLSFSQQKEIDSINDMFSQIKNDSLYNLKLEKTIEWYRYRDPKINLYFIKKALRKSTNDKDEIKYAYWTRELAFYHEARGDSDSTYYYLNKSLSIYKANNEDYYAHFVKSSLAQYWQDLGEYTKSIKYYNEVISFFEKQGEKEASKVILTKMNLTSLYDDMEQLEEGLKINLALYAQLKTDSNKERFARLCTNIASEYMHLEKHKEGLKYALEVEGVEQNPKATANLYSTIGSLYSGLENYTFSDKYYKKALKIYEEIGLLYSMQIIYHNIGNDLMVLGKYKEAEPYLLKTNAFFQKNDRTVLADSYFVLSELYEGKKDFKKALSYYKKREVIRDSVIGIEKQKAIVDIEIKYETEKTKREKEAAEQQVLIAKLESNKNRNLFLGSIVIAGLLLLASLFYFGRLKAKKKAQLIAVELQETQKRLAIEKQYKDSELKALKAQMNPHFIFNALNSIQDYIVLNQKNLASDYLGKFADLIRNYLHFSDTSFISIPDEVHNLNLYLELEKLRFEEELSYSIQVDNNANSEMLNIPTMLIQPYVENALKHGLLHKKDNRKLHISVSKVSDKLIECVIEDNGVGREKSKEINQKREAQHKSFALKATTERLDLLNYGKDKKIGVEIIDLKDDDKATGTKVILTIPILNT